MLGLNCIMCNCKYDSKKKTGIKICSCMASVGVGTLVLDCFPKTIGMISEMVGIASPVNMLFFFGFAFSLMIIFVLTVAVSRMSIRIKQLAQELALYQKDNEK